MPSLHELITSRPLMSLDELVETTNALLPAYLPGDPANTRVRNEVNPRLVRHYTSEGLLDEPLKEGREARYEIRHLLQLMVVRRLLAEGLATGAIDGLARSRSDHQLLQLLEGGVRVEIAPTMSAGSEALAFLDRIRRRSPSSVPAAPAARPAPAPPAPAPAVPRETRWDRYPLLDGLELHVRSDFRVPTSLQEQRNLLGFLTRKLIEIQQRRQK